MKKVPKTDKVHTQHNVCTVFSLQLLQADPKRVKKALPKIIKTMKAEDRVMVIGVTKFPFGELANMCMCVLPPVLV